MNSSFSVSEETVDELQSRLNFFPYVDNGGIVVPEKIDTSAATSGSVDEGKEEKEEGNNSFRVKDVKSCTVISETDLQNECQTNLNMNNQVGWKPLFSQLKIVPEELASFATTSSSVDKEKEKEGWINSSPVNVKQSTLISKVDLQTKCKTNYNEKNRVERNPLSLQLKVVKGEESVVKTGHKTKYIIVRPQKLMPKEKSNEDRSYPMSSDESDERRETGYPCLRCGVVASKESTAKLHNNAHKSGYLCLYCPQAFFKKHTAEMHIELHGNGGVKQVYDTCQCKICGGSFIALMYLEFHVIEMHGEEILSNPKVIHFPSSNIDEVGDLRLNDSKKIKKYKCGICNALFTYPLNLDSHMEFHKESIFSCGLCKSSYTLLDDLLLHIKIHENKSLNTMFEDYLSNFEDCLMEEEDGDLQTQSSFEQILEIEDQTQIETISDDEPHFSGVKQRVPSGKIQVSRKGGTRPNLKVSRNNVGRSSLRILNRKIITRKGDSNQCRNSNQTNYKIKTKNWVQSGNLIGREYINPYLFHFLPNGKYSHYFDNIQ